MTTSVDLAQRLRDLTAEQLSVSPAALTPDAELGDDLGLDSLEAIELGMSIEDGFGSARPEDAGGYERTYGMVDDLGRGLVEASADTSGKG